MLPLLILTVIAVVFGIVVFLIIQPKATDNNSTVLTGSINIIVENKQVTKQKATDRDTIVGEAEAMFRTLQKKYLYSPIPFKVLGEFYTEKGLMDMAVEKYIAMIPFLNQELDIEKLQQAISVLRSYGQEQLADKIIEYYKE